MTKTKHVLLMPKNPNKVKSSPKPSMLLTKALALFGPSGKWWIKGAYKINKGISHHKSKASKDRFCSVGALQQINTLREPEAYFYLCIAAATLRPKEAIQTRMSYNPITFKNYEYDKGPKSLNPIIFNDAHNTKWSDIKKLFKTATKLAQADGN